jgi:NodT family efflux transporter outer membrane factor (OMF) lipoprotein
MGAVFVPAVDGVASANRQKMTGAVMGQENAPSSTFSLYNASVNVSYTFDIFGGARREIEALEAKVNYQQYQLEAARLALTANIVTTAVKEASFRAQIQATRAIVTAQEQQLAIVEQQYELGGVSRSDVLAQQTQVAVARATLPPLEKGLGQTRHQLAVLVGKFPSEASALPEFTLEELKLPQELPVSLPSSLVRQRPDIQASEALLHAASAQIGVATANMYPRITLSGSLGSEALKLSNLFGPGTGVWSLGAGLLQPLFHGGELSARRRAAIASYDGAAAQYRLTVLQAFQSVADVLRALDSDAASLKAQAEAAASARESLAISQKQFDLGSVSYLSVLNAQRQYQLTSVSLAQAQAARVADTAALFQALGGGWWNRAADEKAATDKTGNQR